MGCGGRECPGRARTRCYGCDWWDSLALYVTNLGRIDATAQSLDPPTPGERRSLPAFGDSTALTAPDGGGRGAHRPLLYRADVSPAGSPTPRPSGSALSALPGTTPPQLLAAALATDPARPLLTFYDDRGGERTELSVATFANWVAKTANLLREDLDLQPGARVELGLPPHWQAVVWLHACWALRLVPSLPAARRPPGNARHSSAPDLAVVPAATADPNGAAVISLALGPMGLPVPGLFPAYAGALDYDREVHAHGDRFIPVERPVPQDLALLDDDAAARLSGADLVAAAGTAADALPPSGRVLVATQRLTPAAVVATALVPLVAGSTTVLCLHLDPARLASRVVQEDLAVALAPVSEDRLVVNSTVPAWSPLGRT